MMEQQIGRLTVRFGLDGSEFSAGLAKAEAQLRGVGEKFEQLGSAMTNVGSRMTMGLTAPIAGIGIGALKAAADWETAMTMVAKTVDAPASQLAKLGKEFQSISEEVPVSANALANLAALAGQLGIETENIVGFTRTMAALGVTTNLSAEEAADSLARLANITGMSQKDFDRLGSTIVELGNNLATTEREIVEFGLRIAGAGEIAGLTEAEIMSIGAAMSSVGIEAEAGGTAVQKVLLGMTESVNTGGAHLEIFAQTAGVSAAEFARVFREDAAEAFTMFVEGLGKQGQNAFGTLEKLELGDQRLIRSFLSLAGAGDLLRNAIGLGTGAWEANIALTNEAEKFYGTLSNQLVVLKNQVVNTASELGAALMPAFEKLLSMVPPLLEGIRRLVGVFAEMSPTAQAVVLVVAGLAAAIGPLLMVGGTLLTMIGASIKAWAILRTTLIAMSAAQSATTVTTAANTAATAANAAAATANTAAVGGVGKAFGLLATKLLGVGVLLGTVAGSFMLIKRQAEESGGGVENFLTKVTPIGALGKNIRDVAESWDQLSARLGVSKDVADKVGSAFDWLTGRTNSLTAEFVEHGLVTEHAGAILDEYADRLRRAGASEEEVQTKVAELSGLLQYEESQVAATGAEWQAYGEKLDALGPIGDQVRVAMQNLANEGIVVVTNALANAGNQLLSFMDISGRFTGVQQQLRGVTAENAKEFETTRDWLVAMIPAAGGAAKAQEDLAGATGVATGAATKQKAALSESEKAIRAATDAMSSEIDKLQGVEGWERKLADAIALATPAQREQLELLAATVRQNEAAAAATEAHEKAMADFQEEAKRVIEANNAHADSLKDVLDGLALEKTRLEQGEEAYQRARLALEDFTEDEIDLIVAQDKANKSMERQQEAVQKLGEVIGGFFTRALESSRAAQDRAREAHERAVDAFESARSGFADRIQQLQLENIRLTEGEEAYQRRALAIEGATQEEIELIMALQRSNSALEASQAAAEAVAEAQTAYEETTAAVTAAQHDYRMATDAVAVAQSLLSTATGEQAVVAQEALEKALRDQNDAYMVLSGATADQGAALATLNQATAEADTALANYKQATADAQTASTDMAAVNLNVVAPSMAEAQRAVEETGKSLGGFGSTIKEVLFPILESFFTGDLSGWLENWGGFWEAGKGLLAKFGIDIDPILTGLKGVFGGWIDGVGSILKGGLKGILDDLGGMLGGFLSDALGWLGKVTGLFNTAVSSATTATAAITAASGSAVTAAAAAAAAAASAAASAGGVVGVAGTAGGLSVGAGIPTIGGGAGGAAGAGAAGGLAAQVVGAALPWAITAAIPSVMDWGANLFGADNQYTDRYSAMLAQARSDEADRWAGYNTGFESGALTGNYGSDAMRSSSYYDMPAYEAQKPTTVILEVDGYRLGQVALANGVDAARMQAGISEY